MYPDQGSLPGFDQPPPAFRGVAYTANDFKDDRRQTLFFALLPPRKLAELVEARALGWQRGLGLRGKVQIPERQHITVCAVAGSLGAMPDLYIEAARNVAASIRQAPLSVRLDRLHSFPESHALVLTGEEHPAIVQLGRLLADRLKALGLKPHRCTTPHLTLLYDERHRVDEQAIEPVRWTAYEFALVLSHVGKTRHEKLGSWPLLAA